MPKLSWEYFLEAQQEDFVQRLKASLNDRHLEKTDNICYLRYLDYCPEYSNYFYSLSSYNAEKIHFYFHDLQEREVDDFCRKLVNKYRDDEYPDWDCYDADKYVNNFIGKVGEEVVKLFLKDLVSEVDYQLYEGGDGGVDLVFKKGQAKINIQVKTTPISRISWVYIEREGLNNSDLFNEYQCFIAHGGSYVDRVKWKVIDKDLQINQIVIFVLFLNHIDGEDFMDKSKGYQCAIGGFKPTNLLTANSDIRITDLFYSGGIRPYLRHFVTDHE